jgi:sarcosine oxidase subunit alpha
VLEYGVTVVGGGPAGLSAAIAAAEMGATVALIDRQDRLGGQLIKQTHKFFGSRHERAGTRGIEIARQLASQVQALSGVHVYLEATALGYYSDSVLTVEHDGRYRKFLCSNLVVCAGASEKMLLFPNNDLPGIYGAGAVQTLMNVHGVMPGTDVVMVGAGNIGLIVSYQLRQAQVNVAAVVEAAPRIGGYTVHASKIRRLGIPILTSHSVKEAHGVDGLEGITVWRVDSAWRGVPGTERYIACDALCLAVGLSPLTELLWQAGCEMKYVPEFGGHVPVTNHAMETTVPGIFAAGDSAGVEEASSAMLTGRLAGLSAARRLGICPDYDGLRSDAQAELAALRAGPTAAKVRAGIVRLRGEEKA